MEREKEFIKDNMDISEEILKVCKNHAQLESNLNRTKTLLLRIKATNADVHTNNDDILKSLKTLNYLNEQLNMEEIIKNSTTN
ncbi:hypothetical protein K502DRAFT_361986 [Neoconidiobolus thromboides FSU 785]|nr:hypothetical protein K502DRAFT_361986 [Neoconidiobolus thromboides FSU 785]